VEADGQGAAVTTTDIPFAYKQLLIAEEYVLTAGDPINSQRCFDGRAEYRALVRYVK
jgi:hypothetical protein